MAPNTAPRRTHTRAAKKGSEEEREQTTIEYLMNYSWTILIIGVVMAVLFQLHIGIPASVCVSQPGFVCSQPALTGDGTLSLLMSQNVGTITATGIGCSGNQSVPSTFYGNGTLTEQAGQNYAITTTCPVSNNQLGQSFSGTVWMKYNTASKTGLIAEIGSINTQILGSTVLAGGYGSYPSGGTPGSGSGTTTPIAGQGAFVQGGYSSLPNTGGNANSTTPGKTTLPGSVASGDSVYVIFADSATGGSCETPQLSDTLGDTFTKVSSACENSNGNTNYVSIWKASAVSGGSDSISVLTGSVTGGILGVLEVNQTVLSEVSHSASGTSSTTPGSYTMTGFGGEGLLVSGVSETGGGTITSVSPGWTLVSNGNWAFAFSSNPSDSGIVTFNSSTGGVTGWAGAASGIHTGNGS